MTVKRNCTIFKKVSGIFKWVNVRLVWINLALLLSKDEYLSEMVINWSIPVF